MSFRDRVERLTDTHYVLPRIGPMRVDVHAFLSPALLAQASEQLWRHELAPLHRDIDREMRTVTRKLGGVETRVVVGNTDHAPGAD